MDMNFCRRCGQSLLNDHDHVYVCTSKHVIFANSSPAVSAVFVNDKKEALIAIRGLEPGIGNFDIPGGFVDGAETAEDGLKREMQEELSLTPNDYEPPNYVLTHIDPYEYKGETIPVLSLMFWARIKPNATIKPEDDVAEAVFMRFEDMDFAKFQFPSGAAVVKRLRELDVL